MWTCDTIAQNNNGFPPSPFGPMSGDSDNIWCSRKPRTLKQKKVSRKTGQESVFSRWTLGNINKNRLINRHEMYPFPFTTPSPSPSLQFISLFSLYIMSSAIFSVKTMIFQVLYSSHFLFLICSIYPAPSFTLSLQWTRISAQLSLSRVCMGAEIHLPSKNDIILFLHSQSDASTWNPAFMDGVMYTREADRALGLKTNRCADIHVFVLFF